MSYVKQGYEVEECFCGNSLHRQVVVVGTLDGRHHREAIEFHRTEAEAVQLQEKWTVEFVHEATCTHRISWAWNTVVPDERRREIDLWFNSLTDEERVMVRVIYADAAQQAMEG